MLNRKIALVLVVALLLAGLAGVSAAAEAKATTVKLKLGVKETYQIESSAIPGAEGQTLEYKSSNKKVATVSKSGLITAKKKGTAKIGVGYGSTVLATCTVTVLAAPKKVTLSDKSVTLHVGDTKQLTATLPSKTASALTFKSKDEAVATVDAAGKVTAVAAGKTTVAVGTFNGKTAKCTVTVLSGKAPTTLSVNASDIGLQVGESFKLVPSVDEGSDAAYKFATKDKKIATVNSGGTVKGVKKGSTKITVTTQNGLTKTVRVVVVKKRTLTETSGFLTNSTETYLANAERLKLTKDEDATFQGTMYHNSQLALIMTANSCQVSLNPATNPKYSLMGVTVYMSPEQAAVKLVEQGWAQVDKTTADGIETRTFAKDGDTSRTVSISTDGTSIRSIDAWLKW